MYNYTYDTETGGLLLNTSPMQFSKSRVRFTIKIRSFGLINIGLMKQDSLPYMWSGGK